VLLVLCSSWLLSCRCARPQQGACLQAARSIAAPLSSLPL
jgi:hypothetical protein